MGLNNILTNTTNKTTIKSIINFFRDHKGSKYVD